MMRSSIRARRRTRLAPQRRVDAAWRWLAELPLGVLLVVGGAGALDASSDLANTFGGPRRSGPLVAVALCLTIALAFACFLRALRPDPCPPRHQAARLLLLPLALWALWTGA
ncbi:MAG: hypothetical protein IVW57_11490 [Ktedonobacterales bacterium]|nr:hypothetical protein [Ktedonobacterales bacterium]